MKPDTTHQFRLGPICSQDELEELWAIDNSAYGAASITYEKFLDWWRAYPPGLLVLHWDQRIGVNQGTMHRIHAKGATVLKREVQGSDGGLDSK